MSSTADPATHFIDVLTSLTKKAMLDKRDIWAEYEEHRYDYKHTACRCINTNAMVIREQKMNESINQTFTELRVAINTICSYYQDTANIMPTDIKKCVDFYRDDWLVHHGSYAGSHIPFLNELVSFVQQQPISSICNLI